MKKIIAILSILITLSSCAILNPEEDSQESSSGSASSEIEFTYVSEEGYFYLDAERILSIEEAEELIDSGKKVLYWYSDPSCSGCFLLENETRESMEEILGEEYIIQKNVLTFLSKGTENDFSNQAAGYMLSVIEHQPEIGKEFYDAIMGVEFRSNPESTKELYEPMKKLYSSIKGSEEGWGEVSGDQTRFIGIAKVNNKRFESSELVLSKIKNKEEGLSIPFLFTEDSEYFINLSESGNDIADFVRREMRGE